MSNFWSETGVRYWGQNVILRHMTSWHVNCTHIYVNGYVIITGHCVIITDMTFMCSKGMGQTTAQVLSRREQMLVWSMFRRGLSKLQEQDIWIKSLMITQSMTSSWRNVRSDVGFWSNRGARFGTKTCSFHRIGINFLRLKISKKFKKWKSCTKNVVFFLERFINLKS